MIINTKSMIQQQRSAENENSLVNLVKSFIAPIKKKEDEVVIEEKVTSNENIGDDIKDNFISIDDVMKVEIKVGTVITAEEILASEKLYKLSVDFGEGKNRQVLSGIRKSVTVEELVGRQFPFVTNLAPRPMMGMISEAMILAASDDSGLALFNPTKKISNGTQLK